MLLQTPWHISGDAGIERAVAATKNVHKRHMKSIEATMGFGYGWEGQRD
jgi:hypothetical protein